MWTSTGWTIKLNNTDEVNDFINICSKYQYDVDVKCGNRMADGKSAIGMMALGTDAAMNVHFLCDDDDIIDQFFNDISKYVVLPRFSLVTD